MLRHSGSPILHWGVCTKVSVIPNSIHQIRVEKACKNSLCSQDLINNTQTFRTSLVSLNYGRLFPFEGGTKGGGHLLIRQCEIVWNHHVFYTRTHTHTHRPRKDVCVCAVVSKINTNRRDSTFSLW